MAKNTRNTRGRIISAAWELFYEQGYEDTTVEEVVSKTGAKLIIPEQVGTICF